MNYLQLCQELVNELGLSGRPTLADVAGNTVGEIINVTRWIRDAALSIENTWHDWKFHWQRYTSLTNAPAGVAAGQTTLAAPGAGLLVRQWDTRKFRWRPHGVAGALWQGMRWYTRDEMLNMFDPDNATAGPPEAFTVLPDNTIMLSAPLDQAYDFLAEFWQRPVPMAAKTDTPLIPAEYHRAIPCRAAVMYANREDAPELITGMEAELIDILDKLYADQLERQGLRRSATDHEQHSRANDIAQFLQ